MLAGDLSTDVVEVRPFQPEEWQLYKAIRLKALQSDPNVFSSSFAKEAEYPDTRWQNALSDPNIGIFGVFHYEDVIGLTGVALAREDASGKTAKLWGSWLEKNWRRRGLSGKMYQARLDWARAHPTVKQVIVSHRQSNTASKMANQKHGFKFMRLEYHRWPDGTEEPDVFYSLDLGK